MKLTKSTAVYEVIRSDRTYSTYSDCAKRLGAKKWNYSTTPNNGTHCIIKNREWNINGVTICLIEDILTRQQYLINILGLKLLK